MKKILIADDSLFMRKILTDIISNRARKCKIIEAHSGASALDMFIKEKPDLILLDIIMPEGEETGLEVLKKVMKADPKTNIVMITAVGQEVVMEECKKFGAKDYITKPFDEEYVVKTIERYLSV